jgi:hemerythrin-like metal-binding protein
MRSRLASRNASHFDDEGSLQRQFNYKKYDSHKEKHKSYIAEVKKMKEEFAEHGVSAKFTISLNSSLTNWIISHIKVDDAEFGKYYREGYS